MPYNFVYEQYEQDEMKKLCMRVLEEVATLEAKPTCQTNCGVMLKRIKDNAKRLQTILKGE